MLHCKAALNSSSSSSKAATSFVIQISDLLICKEAFKLSSGGILFHASNAIMKKAARESVGESEWIESFHKIVSRILQIMQSQEMRFI